MSEETPVLDFAEKAAVGVDHDCAAAGRARSAAQESAMRKRERYFMVATP
jgi:hypothetical protein